LVRVFFVRKIVGQESAAAVAGEEQSGAGSGVWRRFSSLAGGEIPPSLRRMSSSLAPTETPGTSATPATPLATTAFAPATPPATTLATTEHLDIARVLFTAEEIAARVAALGAQITQDYAALGAREITLIGVANGAMVFVADLLRTIRLHTRFDTVRVSTYADAASPAASPIIRNRWRLDLAGRHLLLLDDILDTGNTLAHVHGELLAQNPAALRTCVLLDKKARRQTPFAAEYTGFEIPDAFVVGYGLDFAERYRNLPFVGVLKPEKQNTANWE
jgi:hypoxanthine phosphoribosyltransferase